MLYFDHNATTPVASPVADAYTEALRDCWGNPSSIHASGQSARQALEQARRGVGDFFGVPATDVVWTSGGTESNNLALFGVAQTGGHIVTTEIEHPAVLGPCQVLEQRGMRVTYVPVGAEGVVDPDDVRRAICPDTSLISVMHANNETGAIQPIGDIAAVAKEHEIPVHSDGVQAAGKIPVNVPDLGVHLYSVSAHKLYAPKGIGALLVRKNTPLRPLHFGGRHERERRAGTENVPGAVAFATAVRRLRFPDGALRDRFESQILQAVPDCVVNSAGAPRLPNTSCITFRGISGEALVIALDMRGMAVSSGSACSSGSIEPSHVLLAMGLSRADAKATVRFSFGESNTADDIDQLTEAVIASVRRLRKRGPKEVNVA